MRAKTKNNQKNAVEQGRMQCVKADVQRTRSNNAGKHSMSQIEVIQSLIRSWEKSAKYFSFFKWEW
jgi:hypothetical protein